jgi:hypothetical protein
VLFITDTANLRIFTQLEHLNGYSFQKSNVCIHWAPAPMMLEPKVQMSKCDPQYTTKYMLACLKKKPESHSTKLSRLTPKWGLYLELTKAFLEKDHV